MKNAADKQFERLVKIMRVLRGPGGCPWDQKQTRSSLRRFLLEETYEVIDAIDSNNPASLREELGDYIFEAVFVAQLSEEAGDFSIGDVLNTVCGKLIRRHPYVFNRKPTQNIPTTSKEALEIWRAVKAKEKLTSGERSSVGKVGTLSDIPSSLPALLRAYKINSQAASVGFDWDKKEQVFSKIEEEVDELKEALQSKTGIEEELGDVLFSIVNLSRHLNLNPESTLKSSIDKFSKRFKRIEKKLKTKNIDMQTLSLEELDEIWENNKK